MTIVRRILVSIILLVTYCALVAAQSSAPAGSKLTSAKPAPTTAQTGDDARIAGGVAREEFVIGTGDVLAINVWKETEVSRVDLGGRGIIKKNTLVGEI